jgi:hypothetical protein
MGDLLLRANGCGGRTRKIDHLGFQWLLLRMACPTFLPSKLPTMFKTGATYSMIACIQGQWHLL